GLPVATAHGPHCRAVALRHVLANAPRALMARAFLELAPRTVCARLFRGASAVAAAAATATPRRSDEDESHSQAAKKKTIHRICLSSRIGVNPFKGDEQSLTRDPMTEITYSTFMVALEATHVGPHSEPFGCERV